MEAAWVNILMLILILALIWVWKKFNSLWLTPKRLEKILREQGLRGSPYRFKVGDTKETLKMQMQAMSKPMNLFSNDIGPRVSPYDHYIVNKHGTFMSNVIFFHFILLQVVLLSFIVSIKIR